MGFYASLALLGLLTFGLAVFNLVWRPAEFDDDKFRTLLQAELRAPRNRPNETPAYVGDLVSRKDFKKALDDFSQEVRKTLNDGQEEQKAQGDRLQEQVQRMQKALAENPKTAAAGANLELQELLKKLKELEAFTQTVRDVKSLANDLAQLRKGAEQMQAVSKRLDDSLEALKQESKQQPGLDKLSAELVKLREQLKPSPAEKVLPEPADVLVLAMNSKNLELDNYVTAFRDLFNDPVRAGLGPNYRTALAWMDGADGPMSIYGFTDTQRKETVKFPGAVTGTTDRLSDKDLPGRLKALFQGPSQGTRTCVVVASVRCDPVPPDQYASWNGLRVHAILIGRPEQVNTLSGERLRNWADFCAQGRGQLIVLTENSGAAPDALVLERLRGYLRDWTQPAYPTRR